MLSKLGMHAGKLAEGGNASLIKETWVVQRYTFLCRKWSHYVFHCSFPQKRSNKRKCVHSFSSSLLEDDEFFTREKFFALQPCESTEFEIHNL
jgi:hypothetical protein